MKDDNTNLKIEICLKDGDTSACIVTDDNFHLSAKDKMVLLISLHQLKEKIINDELCGKEKQ